MDADIRELLADRLADVLPSLRLDLGAPGHPDSRPPGHRTELLVSAQALVSRNPELAAALREADGTTAARLRELTLQALEASDPALQEALGALLGEAPGEAGSSRGASSSDGLVARSIASAWMNLLVALTVFGLVGAALWAGLDRSLGREGVLVDILKVFVLWCLSFLPGWLYIRFLGQRAGALWSEFVLHLHRLGWDEPGFLPRPPSASAYFEEWLKDGGPRHNQKRNLYRQKFDAYYGKGVADSIQGTNYAGRTDSMFPVFLATAVLTAGWAAVLWDPTFLLRPTTLWDMLRFAFLGAYAFIVQSLIRRFFQSDLRPSAYAAAVLRVVLVLLVMTGLHQIVTVTGNVEAAVAFMVGIFPIIALQALQRVAATALRVVVPQLTPDYPLNQLDGLNIWYEARLLEEGIEDMQNLATANLVDVLLHTRVPVGRLIDWVDQAALYIHLDRAERGFGERRLVRKARKQTVAELSKGSPDPARRTRGSVNPALRAGTQTRVALRQVGIRTATDLLKAFPPDHLDPTAATSKTVLQFRELLPEGLEPDQIRTLVRVLDEDVDLAPVWNWQGRGVLAHDENHRPRSIRPPTGRRRSTVAGQPPNGVPPSQRTTGEYPTADGTSGSKDVTAGS
jgi:hypothetical protein